MSAAKRASKASAAKKSAKASAAKRSPKQSRAKTAVAQPAAEPLVTVTVQEGVLATRDANKLRVRAEKMLLALGCGEVELSLAFVDDAVIRDLNKRWRKKDKHTDVLSFPMHDLEKGELLTVAASQPLLLGDVIVSVPTATRQGKAHKRSPLDEITWLLAHGVLHLFGFDHKTDDQEREMNAFAGVLNAAALNKRPLGLGISARS